MSKSSHSSKHGSRDTNRDQRTPDALQRQSPEERQARRNEFEDHYGAQRGQAGALGGNPHGGHPSQGYGTQMSGGTQSGQQSGTYSSTYGREPPRGTWDYRDHDDQHGTQRGFGGVQQGSRPRQSQPFEEREGLQHHYNGPRAQPDQDFGQQPGFGGFGPEGGGYGSQRSYASHSNYRYPGDQAGQSGHGAHGEASSWEQGRQRIYGGQQPDAGWPRSGQRRGPKGYQRSDERIREDICEHLLHSGHIDSTEVTVEVSGGRVILEGTVPDRRMKHAIEDVADATSGVNDVENRVRVVRSWPHMREEQRGDGSGSDTRGEDVTQRHGTGTTSSHTSTGTQTEEHATGASEGATFGGATTALSEDASGSGAPYQGNNTASRGPGTADDLAGRSVSSSSTAKPPSE